MQKILYLNQRKIFFYKKTAENTKRRQEFCVQKVHQKLVKKLNSVSASKSGLGNPEFVCLS